jgi:hypothetical protein
LTLKPIDIPSRLPDLPGLLRSAPSMKALLVLVVSDEALLREYASEPSVI